MLQTPTKIFFFDIPLHQLSYQNSKLSLYPGLRKSRSANVFDIIFTQSFILFFKLMTTGKALWPYVKSALYLFFGV